MPGSRHPIHLARTGALVGVLILSISAIAGSATGLQAQESGHGQETAALRWGTRFVWFRPTDAGTVQVFASAGYRNAFAQPVTISADDADRWAGLADQLASAGASQAASSAPVMPL